MKKKSIFVVALAALMLIAFTACEQPVPGLSKSIIDATIVQNGTFLVGQPYDASKFSVNVTYSDKSTGTLEGVNVVYAEEGGDASSVQNGDNVEVTLPFSAPNYSGTSNVQKDVTFTGSIVAYTIDSITVSGPATVNSTDGSAKAPKASDLSAVASYRDSSGAVKTVNLIAADLSLVTTGDGAPAFVDKDTTEVTKDEPTALASVKVYVKWQSAAAANFQYTVQYVESTGPAPEYEYDYLVDDADIPVVGIQILDETSSNRRIQRGLFDAEDFVAVYHILVPVDEDGAVVEKTDFVEAYTTVGLDAPEYYQLEELKPASGETLSISLTSPLAGTTDRFDEAETAELTFEYEYIADPIKETYGTITNSDVASITYDEDGAIVVTEATAPEITDLIADYATDVDIVWNYAEEGYEDNAIEAGTTFDDGDFTITATEWKSGYKPETAEEVSGTVVFDPEEAPSRTSAGWINIKATYGDRTYTDSQFEVTGIRVYIAADGN